MHITRETELPADAQRLARLASHLGHNHLDRLISEFEAGINRFDRPGEALFVIRGGDRSLIGVGGLNIDPYYPQSPPGRVRRLFIHPSHRRKGVGSVLMRSIEAYASHYFTLLQLFTSSATADAFYTSLGYDRVHDRFKVSHAKRLGAQGCIAEGCIKMSTHRSKEGNKRG